ncbi:putative Alpha/beta-hydrolase [Seiridium cardinale]
MTSHRLPAIVLVPGAFGAPAGFDKLAQHLRKAGLSTYPGPYPSHDPVDPSVATCERDIAFLRNNYLLPLLDKEQKDVVVVAHSYGGIVAGGAAKGLGKSTRRQALGKATGVIGLVYIAGNITSEGESLLQAIGGAYPPFIKRHKPLSGVALIEPAQEILYNDMDPEWAQELGKRMKPHAMLAFQSPATAPAWADTAFDGRRAYVRTSDDCCNPPFLQDAWIQKTKVKWNVVNFKSGHMPFESRPDALSEQIVSFVDGFQALEKSPEEIGPGERLKSEWDRFYLQLLFATVLIFSFCWLYWI